MQDKLKELYEVRKKVDDAVEENFGYSPDYKWFDDLIEQMRELEFEVKTVLPDEWAIYSKKYY